MSKYGLFIAKLYGRELPSFNNPEEAKKNLFKIRDEHLSVLEQVAERQPGLNLDYSLESLKRLEAWYFDLYERDSFSSLGIERSHFETCIGIYFGAVLARNKSGAEWIVEEFAFQRGKYELGVRLQKGITVMAGRQKDLFRTHNNKKRQSLFRTCARYLK